MWLEVDRLLFDQCVTGASGEATPEGSFGVRELKRAFRDAEALRTLAATSSCEVDSEDTTIVATPR